MHVSAFLYGLGVLVFPYLLASSNFAQEVGSKRTLEIHENYEGEDFMTFFNGFENEKTYQMESSESLSFPPDIFASGGESKVAEIVIEYLESTKDLTALKKLINCSKISPQETVYQILSMGELELMTMKFYYEAYISDEKIRQALRNLFYNISCKKKLLDILRIHINLLLSDPDLVTPKSVLISFKNISVDLFGISTEREFPSRAITKNYSKFYQLFLKIYAEINLVHLTSSKDLYNFNKHLTKSFPDFLVNLDQIDLFRVALNFVFWDDVDELNQIVSNSTEIVIFIPRNCSSLLHFATEWESTECLDFLVDLVHEIAIIEPETGGISPFVYALILKNKSVLEVYAKHGFNDETTVTIDYNPIIAAELTEQTNDPEYSEYFQNLIKK